MLSRWVYSIELNCFWAVFEILALNKDNVAGMKRMSESGLQLSSSGIAAFEKLETGW